MATINSFKKGSSDLLILHILYKKGDCYGYELNQLIKKITDNYISFPEGSMYPALYKLIDAGYISDYKRQVGKRLTRVYYHIEPLGIEHLQNLTDEFYQTTASIKQILSYDYDSAKEASDE